jgi:hypothetical protein
LITGAGAGGGGARRRRLGRQRGIGIPAAGPRPRRRRGGGNRLPRLRRLRWSDFPNSNPDREIGSVLGRGDTNHPLATTLPLAVDDPRHGFPPRAGTPRRLSGFDLLDLPRHPLHLPLVLLQQQHPLVHNNLVFVLIAVSVGGPGELSRVLGVAVQVDPFCESKF